MKTKHNGHASLNNSTTAATEAREKSRLFRIGRGGGTRHALATTPEAYGAPGEKKQDDDDERDPEACSNVESK